MQTLTTDSPNTDLPFTNLGDLLGYVSQRYSDKGITYLDSASATPQFQSYAALRAEVETICAGLRANVHGTNKILIQLERTRDIIPAFWACIWGGYVPLIGPLAPSYRESNLVFARLGQACERMEKPFVLTSESLLPIVSGLDAVGVAGFVVLDQLTKADAIAEQKKPAAIESDRTAFLSLSSGSGGKTKCVALSHRNVIANQHGANLKCQHTSEDVIFNWLPFDHIGAVTDWHVRPMLLGCNLVYASKEEVVTSPLRWLDRIQQFGITHTWAPNFAYINLNRSLSEAPPEAAWDLSSLRFLLSVGEPVSYPLMQALSERLASSGLRKSAVQVAWGMTELAGGTVYSRDSAESEIRPVLVSRSALAAGEVELVESAEGALTLLDLGGPHPHALVRIVDADGKTLPELTLGSVQVGGPSVFQGYLNDEEATREVLVEDGWFRTGDLGFLRDGRLVISGREKSIVIVNGLKYFGHDVEVCAESVPGVLPGSAAACSVRETGSVLEQLCIFFVPMVKEVSALEQIGATIRERLSRELGVSPDVFIALPAERIPRTAIGKIVRQELVKRFEAGQYREFILLGESVEEDSGPMTPVEEAVAMLWTRVLRKPCRHAGENFFRLGGNSLLATQLLGLLRSTFRVNLALPVLFAAPTVRELAANLVALEAKPGLSTKVAELLLREANKPRPAQPVTECHPA